MRNIYYFHTIILVSLFLVVTNCQSQKNNWQKLNKEYELVRPSNAQIQMIKSGLKDSVKSARFFRAVKSDHFNRAYYVSAILSVPETDSTYSCWLISGSQSQPGMIQSVGKNAVNFTPYPDARNTKTQLKTEDLEHEYKFLKLSYKHRSDF